MYSILSRLLVFLSNTYSSSFAQAVPIKRPIGFLINEINGLLIDYLGDSYIEFEITNICNARCIFCLYPAMLGTNKEFTHMSTDTFRDGLNYINRMRDLAISLTPTTGDILLNPLWYQYLQEIVDSKSVRQVIFYSNAILLDGKNQDRLLEVLENDPHRKISCLFFSVGGLDVKSYKEMFEVNKFDEVRENLNQLMSKLKSKRHTVGVSVQLRTSKEYVWTSAQAHQVLNESNYPFVRMSGLKSYFSNSSLKKYDNLEYLEQPSDTSKACSYLNKTRISAEGLVWADGCVMSEVPNNDELKLGTLKSSISEIEKNRRKIIDNWETKGDVPLPCQNCSAYRCNKK